MISISTTIADPNGNVVLYELPTSNLNDMEARVTRTATLDGNSFIDHQGVSDGDRTLTVISPLKQPEYDNLVSIFRRSYYVMVSISTGLYLCVIKSVMIQNNQIRTTILIEREA